ncbi:MAG: hypothetical protein ACFFDN_47140 [Candidatus Hodarchaeota archaeon]
MTLEKDELATVWLGSISSGFGFVLLIYDFISIHFAIIFLSIAFIIQSLTVIVNNILNKSISTKVKYFEIILGLILVGYGIYVFVLIVSLVFRVTELNFIIILIIVYIINLAFSRLSISIINNTYSRWFRIWLVIESLLTLVFGIILLQHFTTFLNTSLIFLAEICALLGGLSNYLYGLSLILKRYENSK